MVLSIVHYGYFSTPSRVLVDSIDSHCLIVLHNSSPAIVSRFSSYQGVVWGYRGVWNIHNRNFIIMALSELSSFPAFASLRRGSYIVVPTSAGNATLMPHRSLPPTCLFFEAVVPHYLLREEQRIKTQLPQRLLYGKGLYFCDTLISPIARLWILRIFSRQDMSC